MCPSYVQLALIPTCFLHPFTQLSGWHLRTYIISLARKIDPNDPNLDKIGTPSAFIRKDDQRLAVAIEESRYAVTIQDKNTKRAQRKVGSYVKTINETIGYSRLPVSRLGIRSIWIHKCADRVSIEALRQAFKNKFYVTGNDIIGKSVDYNITLTLEDGNFKVGYMAGPIKKDEPLPNVTFPVSNLGAANVYVSTDCSIQSPGKIAPNRIPELISAALQIGEEEAGATLNILEVG